MMVAMVCVAFECPLCPGATASFDGGIVIRSGDPEYAEGGTWEIHKVGDYYLWPMDSVDCRKTSSAGAWAKWTPDLKAGKHRVYWWHNRFWWGNSGQVTIEIRHAGGTATIKRDNGDGPIGWSNLGDYEFAAGSDGHLKVTLEGKGTMYASGAKFLPADKVDKTTFPPYPQPDGTLPRAEKGNIVVCGQPRLILYGETLEDVMTDAADVPYYGDQFDKWRRQGLNTVGAIIQWNRFEIRKDEYEYAMIDGLIEAAKARNMHLIIVWFGTWRNLQSNYVPRYVWDEKIAFPAVKKNGKQDNGRVSPHAMKCAERDGLALKALLARASAKDPGHQVLIAVQVENEMPNGWDWSIEANAAFKEQVPKELLDYLKANDTPTFDPSKLGSFAYSRYHDNGSRTSGTWEEVFGNKPLPPDPRADGASDARLAMGAYYAGKYIEAVVRKAKEALNIPMYANAWCGESPCDSAYMDIFHIGCPSLDGMGPDSPGDNLFQWIRPWNMLVEPEFSAPENYFRALSLGALLNGHYFANEVEVGARAPIGAVVRAMEPVLVTKRNPGDLLGFYPPGSNHGKRLPKAGHSWEQDYQNLKVKFTLTGDTADDTYLPHTAGPVLGPNGLIMRMGRDEYIITSTKVDVELRRADGGEIAAAWAEEGHFERGTWVKEKDAMVEGSGKSLKLRFPTENLKYGHLRLKIAAPK
jgi:hypothetical protein